MKKPVKQMHTRIGYLSVGLVLGVCAWASAQETTPAAQPPPPADKPAAPADASSPGPRIQINSTVLDFGEVWQGEPAKGDFVITNAGDAPLTISVKSSCGCAVSTKPKSPLAPGESDTMTVSYNTMTRKGKAKQRITLSTNDPAQPQVRIEVLGNVKPLYVATPADGVFFHRLHTNKRDERKILFENRYDGPLNLKLAEGQDFGPFEVAFEVLEPGTKFELTVATKPPLTEQVTRINVVLETGLERTPQLKIPVHAYVQPDVLCRPSLLRIARQGTVPQEKTVQFVCRAEKPVNIVKVETSHESIKYAILPARPSRISAEWITQVIRVTFPPGNELPEEDAGLVIYTDAAEPRFQKFDVRVEIMDQRVRYDLRKGLPPALSPVKPPATQPASPVPPTPAP